MEIKLLSAGAVEPGLAKLFEPFEKESGHAVKATFNTAPAIRRRLAAGEIFDVVIAPPAVLDELVKGGRKVAAERVVIGKVGVGVAVREEGPAPKIATVEEFKRAVLEADALVYNQASTGIYIAGLFERLGIAAEVAAKSTRYPDGAAVLDHLAKGKGNEIGFGAITEILECRGRGVKLVGPLPAEIQNYTSYAAAILAEGPARAAAEALVRYLAGPQGKAALAAAGVE
jgi:molybdate transport system substrate-binding protein